MPINYVKGDATQPIGSENRIITHCCNDQGYWNAGFVKALSHRWPEPERAYRRWATGLETLPFALGNVQFVRVAAGSASRTSLANPALLTGASIIHLQSATKPSAKASGEFADSPSLTQPRSTCHGWPPDSPVVTGKQSPKSSTTSSPIMDSRSPFTT
jgi:hypothetical protein